MKNFSVPPALSPAEKKNVDTHYELLFENGKVWYTSKEAAQLLGMSVQFVRDAFQSQELMGHEISSVREGRRTKLIHRDCLQMYLMQTANYTPKDFIDKIKRLLVRRPLTEQQEIKLWLDRTSAMGQARRASANSSKLSARRN